LLILPSRNCLSQATDCEYATLPKSGAASTTKVKKTIPGERIVPVMTLAEVERSAVRTAPPVKTPAPMQLQVQTRTPARTQDLPPVMEVLRYSSSSSSSSEGGSPDRILGALNPAPSLHRLPPNQHKLLYHMSSIAMSIDATNQSDVVIYLKRLPALVLPGMTKYFTDSSRFLTIAYNYEFVKHGLMAWAASHIGFTTKSQEAHNVAAHFRYLAIAGLNRAIVRFNEKNSDAVLAASLLLSWQAPDP
jgi:hypothetical protein